MLSQDDPPTALFVGPHGLLPGALAAIRSLALHIPADISVVAFGDSVWASVLEPAISVVVVDFVEHARRATELLLCLIEGDTDATKAVIDEARFISRESVGPTPRRGDK